jgi:malonate-semialdehyde dehydrogenase (acetylating)/methylmalonate-semialdehyde dehydrogenase
MAGNAVIVKPSPLVPLSAMMMAELLKDAGLPEGIFTVINGGQTVVEEIIANDDVSAISFVGSTDVAKKIYRDATARLKRALCLGSAKNFLLVLPDADVELTAENIVASAFGMAGQRCMAASAVIAVKDCSAIIDRIVDHAKRLRLGDDVAPIITATSKERIEGLIAEAINDGAHALLDGRNAVINGKSAHNYLAPTILSNVQPSMAIARTEIFGPVLSILRASSVDEAIAMQNMSVYGNGASIYTQSIAMADYIKDKLAAGMIGVNIGVPVPREPFSFGGVKWSKFGVGDITGKSSIAFWTNPVKCTSKWKKEDAVNWMS